MKQEKKKAAATTAARKTQRQTSYQNETPESRAERIAERRADMPRRYRGIYKKAMSGKSLRAAATAFCLECVCWQREEVGLCTSVACPLYHYRPYTADKTPKNGTLTAQNRRTQAGG